MVQNAFIIMNIFIPSISILCNKNDFSKAGSKLSVRLLATNLALLKKYYQLAIVHIANANSILRNWKNKINLLIKIIYFFLWNESSQRAEMKNIEKKSYTKKFMKNPLPTFQMSTLFGEKS